VHTLSPVHTTMNGAAQWIYRSLNGQGTQHTSGQLIQIQMGQSLPTHPLGSPQPTSLPLSVSVSLIHTQDTCILGIALLRSSVLRLIAGSLAVHLVYSSCSPSHLTEWQQLMRV
jgi:hypothetical protein